MVFTKEDRHNEQEKKDFNILLSQKGQLLRLLGDFTSNYMMKHPEVLLRKKKEDCNWKESAKELIVNFYEMADRDPPSWIDLSIEEMQIEDSIDDCRLLLRAFFINLINETFNKYSKIIDGGSDNKDSLQMRFMFCCEQGLIPSISVINEGKTIVIFSSILKELHNPKYGIDGTEIAGLQELANTLGLKYGQKWLNGTNTRVVDGDIARFISFIDTEVKDEDPNARLNTDGLAA